MVDQINLAVYEEGQAQYVSIIIILHAGGIFNTNIYIGWLYLPWFLYLSEYMNIY